MSYPVSTTHIYPLYCYPNFSQEVFSVSCTNQLLICILCVCNLPPLCYLLWAQTKKHGSRKPIKYASLFCMIALQIVTFIHYFFIFDRALGALLTVESLLSSTAFLLICYMFCKQTSRLLPSSKSWFIALKVIAALSLVLYIIFAVW